MILPTTCGTGSEVTSISILNRTSLGTKMGLVSPAMFAKKAVLVPELLSKLPYGVFASANPFVEVHKAVEKYQRLDLTEECRRKLFYENGMKLLGLSSL